MQKTDLESANDGSTNSKEDQRDSQSIQENRYRQERVQFWFLVGLAVVIAIDAMTL